MDALMFEESNLSAALPIVRALGRLGHNVAVAAPWETPGTCARWCGPRGCTALARAWIESRRQRLKAMLVRVPWALRILRRTRGSHANVSAAR
jgi:hypothetical protein